MKILLSRVRTIVLVYGTNRKRLTTRAGSRVRTDDLLITNHLLYQLSYVGVAAENHGNIVTFTARFDLLDLELMMKRPLNDPVNLFFGTTNRFKFV
jgi:hypothetical protein